MAKAKKDRPTDGKAEELVLEAIRESDKPITLVELIATLPRPVVLFTNGPTANQIVEAVRRMLDDGRLIDTFDPGLPGSKHILRIPDPKTNRETMKGLFDQ